MNENITTGIGVLLSGIATIIVIISGPLWASILLIFAGIALIAIGIHRTKKTPKPVKTTKSNEEKSENKMKGYKKSPISIRKYRFEDVLFNDDITVQPADHEKLQYKLKTGDHITGIINETEGDPFNFYIMDEGLYAKYCNKKHPKFFKGDEDITSYPINFTIPYDSVWYFVFDTYGKKIERIINVTLRRHYNI